MWILLAIASAIFLGFYDIFKKLSLQENAVLPTLFWSTVAASLVMLSIVGFSEIGLITPNHLLFVPHLDFEGHLRMLLKTFIVLSSWICTYFALKHLPLTIFAPIRSTGPLWTTLGAFLFFSERLTALQAIGGGTIFIFFYLFSTEGRLEGFSFKRNKYFWLMILGTLLGSISALYDRFLLREMNVMAVEAYFTFYQTLMLIPILGLLWYPKRKNSTPFQWRWTIPFIGLFLLIGDYLYFYSISLPDSLISIISLVRRSNVLIVFLFGAVIFKEKNVKRKALYLGGILIGLIFLVIGR